MVSNVISIIIECCEFLVVFSLVGCIIALIVLQIQDIIDLGRYRKAVRIETLRKEGAK